MEQPLTQPAGAARHETLLAHREWVRALARSLTSRADDADDVEQQTWLAALGAAPDDVRSLRAWLVVVARNAARRLRRTESRQRERAERSDVRPPAASAAELVEQADVHARLVAAVVALGEPYREAILLRYFEGLAVREVAHRAGVPVETARARLRRARAALRDRLEQDLGPARPWRLALLVLAGPAPDPVAGATAVAGGALVTIKSLALVACVAVAAIVGWSVWRPGAGGSQTTAAGGSDTAAAVGAGAGTGAPPPRPRAASDGRDVASSPDAKSPPVEPAPAAPSAPTIAVRLAATLASRDPTLDALDLTGDAPLAAFGRLADATGCDIAATRAAAAHLESRPRAAWCTLSGETSGDQALQLVANLCGVVWKVDGDRIVVQTADETVTASTTVVTVQRPAARPPAVVRGRVRDASGASVAGAEIVVHIGTPKVVASSGADGTFEIRRRGAYATWEGYVSARAAGLVPSRAVRIDAAAPTPQSVDLVVRGPAGTLQVRSTADGAPAAGAVVTIGPESPQEIAIDGGGRAFELPAIATAGADGVATVHGLVPGATAFRVALAGFQSQTVEAVIVAGEIARADVALAKRPSIAGRVRDARVALRVDDVPLRDVIAYLTRITRLNVIAHPDLGDRLDRRVSLALTDEPLENVLRMLCDQAGDATFVVNETDGVVEIRAKPK